MFPYPSLPKVALVSILMFPSFPTNVSILMVVGVFYRPANIVVIRKSWFDFSSSFLDLIWLWGAMMCFDGFPWGVRFSQVFSPPSLFWFFFGGEGMVHGSCWRSFKKEREARKQLQPYFSTPDRYWFMSVAAVSILWWYIYIYILNIHIGQHSILIMAIRGLSWFRQDRLNQRNL